MKTFTLLMLVLSSSAFAVETRWDEIDTVGTLTHLKNPQVKDGNGNWLPLGDGFGAGSQNFPGVPPAVCALFLGKPETDFVNTGYDLGAPSNGTPIGFVDLPSQSVKNVVENGDYNTISQLTCVSKNVISSIPCVLKTNDGDKMICDGPKLPLGDQKYRIVIKGRDMDTTSTLCHLFGFKETVFARMNASSLTGDYLSIGFTDDELGDFLYNPEVVTYHGEMEYLVDQIVCR